MKNYCKCKTTTRQTKVGTVRLYHLYKVRYKVIIYDPCAVVR